MRRHFDDLDLALALVGCVRSDGEPGPPPLTEPEGRRPDEGTRPPAAHMSHDDLPHRERLDGWSLLTDAELEAAAREADDDGGPDPDTEPGADPGAGRGHDGDAGRGRKGKKRVRSYVPRPDTYQYIIPMMLEPADDEPLRIPEYQSVPPPGDPAPRASSAYPAIYPRTSKATMHALMKRRTQSTDIDVEALVHRLSLNLPITETPRLKRDLTAPPMRLLYDTSLMIGPYADDVRHLLGLARALFDPGVLKIRAYRDSLSWGCGDGPVWTWRPFRVPHRPSTMVFVSGGFGGDLRARVRELERVAGELERKGHRAFVLWLGDPPGAGAVNPALWRVIRR
ncbi:hypothetical protein [Sphaerisporangium album]|nr:hypothetical protein [Sphaerisporangium album]